MKIRITNKQFRFILENSHNALSKEFLVKSLKEELINEQKIYSVDFWFGANKTIMMIVAHNGAEARVIAKKMFPNAVLGVVTEFKGKICL